MNFINSVICGDALTELKKLSPMSIDMCFTSPTPPFGEIGQNKVILGSELNTIDYVKHLVEIFQELKHVLKNSGSLFVQMGDYHYNGTLMATPEMFVLNMLSHGWFLRSKLIWHRTEDSKQEEMNRFSRNWEYLFFFTKDPENYYFDSKSNKYYKNSVYSLPSAAEKRSNEFDSGFPEKLVDIAIKTTVPNDGVVLDIMAGTGKTGIVAKKLGKKFIMIEIDENLCYAMKVRFGIPQ
jgi:site-specific DNA-methyltransferase (adenine-specific)